MNSLRFFGISAAALVICVFLREYSQSFHVLLRMAFSVSAMIFASLIFSEIYDYIKEGESLIGIYGDEGEIFKIMLKATGIAFIGSVSASLCRDSGEGGIASSVELVAKLEILILAIPVIEVIFEKIREVLS